MKYGGGSHVHGLPTRTPSGAVLCVCWWATSRRLFLALIDGLDVVATHGCLLVDGSGEQAHA